MNSQYLSIITAAFLLLVPEVCDAQVKLYTKKARMSDFTTKTTKVVAAGHSMLAEILREEVEGRWIHSAYEFCSDSEYEALKESNDYYFLFLDKEEGIVFLNLSKGGRKDDKNNKAKPFEVIRIPIAAESSNGIKDARFIGYAIEAVQNFALLAMESDKVGYKGLKAFNSKNLGGRKVTLDEESSYKALQAEDSNIVAGIVIAPQLIDFESYCYKILITADTREIVYFSKQKYTCPEDARFSNKERNAINRRNGNIL